MESYFKNFPTIAYDGKLCLDLSRRVKIENNIRNSYSMFYPVEIKAGFRSDNLSDAYYEDAEMDWIIYLNNGVVDPYYGWYLNEHDFEDFIIKKYGSIEAALKTVKFYITNGYEAAKEISTDYYNNHLTYDLKKYYTPVYGQGSTAISYVRKKEEWIMNTNKIVQYNFEVTDQEFTPNEVVDIKNNSNAVVGGGTVIKSNTSSITLQHMSGNITSNSTWTKIITGETSNTTVSVNTAHIVVQENISNSEAVFWSSVNAFDWERQMNEEKKNLYILDNSYAFEAVEQFKDKLKE